MRAYFPAAVFAFLVAGRGTPVLRHDWFTLSDRLSLSEFTLSTIAWQPAGIGSVRVYPTDYLFAFVNTALALVFGTHIGLLIYVGLIGALCVYGARALGDLEQNREPASFALSAFALFNPWVYVKVVEGHLAMIAAYGALMALTAELWRAKPRWAIAALLLAPMTQLQFFVVGIVSCACAALLRRERNALLPLLCGFAFELPSIVGFIADSGAVSGTAYNVDWQRLQSIPPVDAAALTGFFTNYTRGFPPVAFDAIWSLAALAAIGIVSRRRARTWVLLAVGIAAWAFSTGTKGPIAGVYVALVEHFPPIELFRELYDILALLAIAYIGVAAVATSRFVALGLLAIVPALVLTGCWFSAPPSYSWVLRSELPSLTVDAPPNTRFALYPDVNPLVFGVRGSGIDPDAYTRAENVTPLNGSDAVFPASVALRRYADTGDLKSLRALGVSRIYDRPWLQSDFVTAAGTSAVSAGNRRPLASASRAVAAAPELSVLTFVSVTRGLPELGSGQIFFGDVAGRTGTAVPLTWKGFASVVPLAPARKRLLAAEDWVDAREAFLAEPELGQALGGAITTSSSASLRVRESPNLLVDVKGKLLSENQFVLTRSTRGYEWIGLPPGSHTLRCAGECVVAAAGRPPAPQPSLLPPAAQELTLHAPVQWFAWATIPHADKETVLKYLVGYNSAMIALTPIGTLPHVRIEMAFNGWLVPRHESDFPVLLIGISAMLQFIFELCGLGLVFFLAFSISNAKRIGFNES